MYQNYEDTHQRLMYQYRKETPTEKMYQTDAVIHNTRMYLIFIENQVGIMYQERKVTHY